MNHSSKSTLTPHPLKTTRSPLKKTTRPLKQLSLGVLSLIALGLSAAPALAEQYDPGFHGNITLTTDNRFRGQALSEGDPALIANFEFVTAQYFYVGVETSNIGNVNFNNLLGRAKLSLYGGAKGPLSDTLNFDFQFSRNLNYDIKNERRIPGGYDEFAFNLDLSGLRTGIGYSKNFRGGTGKYLYPNIGLALGLFDFIDLELHGGYNKYYADATPSYFDWGVAVALNLFSSTKVSFALIGTNLKTGSCEVARICKPQLVISITKVL